MQLEQLTNKFGAFEFFTNKKLDQLVKDNEALSLLIADLNAEVSTLKEARKVQIKLNSQFAAHKLTSKEKRSMWDTVRYRIFK